MLDTIEPVDQEYVPRYSARLAVYFGPDPDKPTTTTGYAVNMSIGGVFIETVRILPVDTPLIVRFKLAANDTFISCNARVAWLNEPGQLRKPLLPPGMGLKFLDLSLVDIRAVRDFLSKSYYAPDW